MTPRARSLLVVLVVPLVIVGLAEVVLRVSGLDPASASQAPRLFHIVQEDGVECFQRYPGQDLPWQPPHPMVKPEGTVRIACIGGSTVAGHPFSEAAFYRVLEHLLGQAIAPRPVECIGAGVGGQYSDGELDVLRELIDRDLDAVVLYSLHNEFHPANQQHLLEAASQGWRVAARDAFAHLAIGRLLMQGLSGPAEVEQSVAEFVPDHPPIEGPEYRLVLEHTRENLEAFVALCQERDVPLMLCTAVSNVRDFPPIADLFDPATPEAERERWNELVDVAARAAARGDGQGALDRVAEAERIDARPARLDFVRGQALLAAGRLEEGRAALRRARDRDGRVNRAVSELNDMVRGFAGRPGVTVVDIERFFDERAPFGITGGEAIVDHVHPSVEGQALIAVRLLQALADAHLFTTPDELRARGLYEPDDSFASLIDEGDQATRVGLENLQLVLEKGRWDATAERAHETLLAAVGLSSRPAQALAGLGLLEGLRGDNKASQDYLQRSAAADPQVVRDWRARAAGEPLVAALLRRADMLEAKGPGR